jgi:hypothetical protein
MLCVRQLAIYTITLIYYRLWLVLDLVRAGARRADMQTRKEIERRPGRTHDLPTSSAIDSPPRTKIYRASSPAPIPVIYLVFLIKGIRPKSVVSIILKVRVCAGEALICIESLITCLGWDIKNSPPVSPSPPHSTLSLASFASTPFLS